MGKQKARKSLLDFGLPDPGSAGVRLPSFGKDIFGNPLKQATKSIIYKRFGVPPFTVLSAREGHWQARKRAWLALGIEAELGRSEVEGKSIFPWDKERYKQGIGRTGKGKVAGWEEFIAGTGKERGGAGRKCHNSKAWNRFEVEKPTAESTQKIAAVGYGPSLFDPVLCEMIYRWFTGPGQQIVDPFAGGSVRGIVATCLGRKYWGGELRKEQVDSNIKQALHIFPGSQQVPIEVSGKMLRQMFHPCELNYVRGTCKGRCCEGSGGIMVTVHESEREAIEAKGCTVKDGFIVADKRGLCPFKSDDGLCTIHGREKPFGCQASPFTLNEKGVLVVRNRYRLLKCFKCEGSKPAHEAHHWSLQAIFGDEEAARISKLAAAGEDRIQAMMGVREYRMLVANDDAKHGRETKGLLQPQLEFVCGDSSKTLRHAPRADFVFSCPPYGDLEVYSNEPGDISNLEWDDFLAVYRKIIFRACKKLRDDRFACFVVGDFRDSKGNYRNFVSETIRAFLDAGLRLYNEAILVTAVGSASLRASRQFAAARKMVKSHQNILVFVKGDGKKATEAMGL